MSDDLNNNEEATTDATIDEGAALGNPEADDTVATEVPAEAVSTPEAQSVTAPEAAPEPVPAPEGSKAKAEEHKEEGQAQKAEEPPRAKKAYVPITDEERMRFPWYVVHVYSGYEMRVKLTLEERIRSAGMLDKFGHVVVPEERVMELVRGEKKTSTRKFFPGYILVQCLLDDDSWHLVKETPKITGFVGDSHSPVPLTDEEVKTLLRQMEGGAQKVRPSVKFEQGDAVKVVDGPFAEFNGTVDEVKADKGKLRVLISIFGRNTPVELDFVQVEKV
jgi:transcription termination/antitermination protein NusG